MPTENESPCHEIVPDNKLLGGITVGNVQMGDKRKTNMKRLSIESGHHEPPEQLQCSLPSLWNSIGWMNTIPPQDIPSFLYNTFS